MFKLAFLLGAAICLLLATAGQTPVFGQALASPQARYQQQLMFHQRLNYQRWLQQVQIQRIVAQQQMYQTQAQLQFNQMLQQQQSQHAYAAQMQQTQGVAQDNTVQVWKGDETLAGYGELTFRLGSNGRATMIDAKDTLDGSWSQAGSTLTLTFGGGNIVYTGTISGRSMTGSATDGDKSWKFSVSR